MSLLSKEEMSNKQCTYTRDRLEAVLKSAAVGSAEHSDYFTEKKPNLAADSQGDDASSSWVCVVCGRLAAEHDWDEGLPPNMDADALDLALIPSTEGGAGPAVACDEDAQASARFERKWWWISVGVVLFFVFILFPAGVYGSLHLFAKLNFANFKAKKGSMIRESTHLTWNNGYPVVWHAPLYILIQSVPRGQSLLEGQRVLDLAEFSQTVESLVANDWDINEMLSGGGLRGRLIPGYRNESLIGGINNDTTVIMGNYHKMDATRIEKKLNLFIASTPLGQNPSYTVQATGMPQLQTAMKDDVLANMGTIDAICIPIGLLVFAWALGKSPFAVLIPLCTLPLSMALAFGLTGTLRDKLKVTAFAPEIASSVIIALSIDFALFLLTRIIEHMETDREEFALSLLAAKKERGNAAGAHAEIKTTGPVKFYRRGRAALTLDSLKSVSHNIVVSGVAITAAFAGLIIIKDDFIRGCAAASAFGAFVATVVSVFMLPAMTILMFPIIFREFETLNRLTAFVRQLPGAIVAKCRGRQSSSEENKDESTPLSPSLAYTGNVWFRIACFSARRPLVTIFGFMCIFALFATSLFVRFEVDDNSYSTVPYNNQYYKPMQEVFRTVGAPAMTPYYIVLYNGNTATNGENLLDFYPAWPLMDSLVRRVLAEPEQFGVGLDDIIAPNVLNGRFVSYNESQNWTATLNQGNVNTHTENYRDALLYKDMLKLSFPGWNYAVIAMYPPGKRANSWGDTHAAYMKSLNQFVEDRYKDEPEVANGQVFLGLYGPQTDVWAAMTNVMDQFKYLAILTFGILTLVVGLLFRSVFVAFRMVSTMVLTVVVAFGTVTALIAHGWFDRVWFPMEVVSRYYWIIPILAFASVCVTSLDYDVFLMTRVLEMHKEGFTSPHLSPLLAGSGDHDGLSAFTDDAGGRTVNWASKPSTELQCVVHAVGRTGPVISWAAIIMVISFGALAFSNTVMLATYGLTIATAVLCDAFLVRPALVPAMIGLLDLLGLEWLLWWPRRVKYAQSQE